MILDQSEHKPDRAMMYSNGACQLSVGDRATISSAIDQHVPGIKSTLRLVYQFKKSFV
jgi:hypothetical protein